MASPQAVRAAYNIQDHLAWVNNVVGVATRPLHLAPLSQAVGFGMALTVGNQASAFGNNINATGYGSVGIGGDDVNKATYEGYYQSHILKRYLTAAATGSFAIGSGAWASGEALLKNGTSQGDEGKFAVALGTRASAYANSAVALGGHSTAEARDALAMMALSRAQGVKSMAMGGCHLSR